MHHLTPPEWVHPWLGWSSIQQSIGSLDTFLQDNVRDHLVSTSVETVCYSHGITDETLQAAEYKPAEKTVLGKVLNYQHILEILVKLRLQECYGTIFTPSRSITYAGGLQLMALPN